MVNPDKILYNKRQIHKYYKLNVNYPHKLDGEGSVFACAFYPNSPIEIHRDLDEKWYYEIDK